MGEGDIGEQTENSQGWRQAVGWQATANPQGEAVAMAFRTTTRCLYCRREIEHLWQLEEHITCVPAPEPTAAEGATPQATRALTFLQELTGKVHVKRWQHGRRRRR